MDFIENANGSGDEGWKKEILMWKDWLTLMSFGLSRSG